ncbi:AAA family ATPase [Mycobacterium sp. URHB0021]
MSTTKTLPLYPGAELPDNSAWDADNVLQNANLFGGDGCAANGEADPGPTAHPSGDDGSTASAGLGDSAVNAKAAAKVAAAVRELGPIPPKSLELVSAVVYGLVTSPNSDKLMTSAGYLLEGKDPTGFDPLTDDPRTHPDFPKQLSTEVVRTTARKDARSLAALEDWEEPENEGHLGHQIANPEPNIGHLVEGLIRSRGIVSLGAQYKVGKTALLSVNLPKALVTGQPFLGRFGVNFGPDECVGIWNMEVDRQDLVDQLDKIGIPDEERKRIFPQCLRGNRAVDFRNPIAVEWAVGWLRERNIKVWVIDPLSKLYHGEENSSTEFNQWWAILEEIAKRAGVRVVVLVHHSGHAGDGRHRGTSAMLGNPDVLLEYRHGGDHGSLPPDNKRYLRAFGRRIDLPETAIDWNSATGELTVSPEGGSRADNRQLELAKKAARVVWQADEKLNQTKLLEAMGVKGKGRKRDECVGAIRLAGDKGWILIDDSAGAGKPIWHSRAQKSPADDHSFNVNLAGAGP